MILDKFLNESSNELENVALVEASKEGFTFEDGGMTKAISLAETEITKLEMAEMVTEAKAVQLIVNGRASNLSESSIMDSVKVLQENVFRGVWSKIKEIARKLWARIISILESVKTWLAKTFNKSAFIKTAKTQLEKYNDFKDLEFEGYEYNHEAVDPKTAFNALKTAIETSIKGISPKANAEGEVDSDEKTKLDDLKQDTYKDTLADKVVSGASSNELKSKIMEKMRSGDTSKKKLTFDKSAAFKFIDQSKSISNTVEGIRSKVNTQFKEALSAMEADEKKANAARKKADGKEVALAQFQVDILKQHSSLLNTALAMCSTVTDCALATIKEETSQTYSFISAALSKAKKNYSKAANESTDLGTGNFLDNIMANM